MNERFEKHYFLINKNEELAAWYLVPMKQVKDMTAKNGAVRK